jgi:uncharacterized protein (DUF2252 family)
MDVVQQILAFNAGREPERLQLKYDKMQTDAFVFLRGTCHLFYQRLARKSLFKSAPPVWSCGDLHFENFGSYKGDNRLAYFDVNDFDEALLAPASWDLVRMLASLQVGAHSLGLQEDAALELCQSFLQSYGGALAQGKAYWVEAQTARGLVGDLLDGLRQRQRPAHLDAHAPVIGKNRKFKPGSKKMLPVSRAQREQVLALMAAFAPTQANPGFYKVLDVARRVAGTGSLGVERYAVLVRGKGSPDANYLLDLKQALPSALAPYVACTQPAWPSQAQRIVALQQRQQAVSMAFLHPVVWEGTSYVLRGLQPEEDRVSLDGARQSLADIQKVITTMGQITAWDQLRSSGRQGSATADELIAFAQGRKWQGKLMEAAVDCRRQVLRDYTRYAQAYADGVFTV